MGYISIAVIISLRTILYTVTKAMVYIYIIHMQEKVQITTSSVVIYPMTTELEVCYLEVVLIILRIIISSTVMDIQKQSMSDAMGIVHQVKRCITTQL